MNEYGEFIGLLCITGAWIHDRYRLFKMQKENEYLRDQIAKADNARFYMARIKSEHD